MNTDSTMNASRKIKQDMDNLRDNLMDKLKKIESKDFDDSEKVIEMTNSENTTENNTPCESPCPCPNSQVSAPSVPSPSLEGSDKNENPFVCEHEENNKKCLKSFKTKSGLKQHKDNHNVEKIYKCNMCDKKYKYQSGLSGHKREKHRIPCSSSTTVLISSSYFLSSPNSIFYQQIHMHSTE